MDFSNPELIRKMVHLQSLVDAVETARQQFVAEPTFANASQYQEMKKQAEAFRRTLPKPKMIVSNGGAA